MNDMVKTQKLPFPENYPHAVQKVLLGDILLREENDNIRIAYELANEIHKGEKRKGIEELDYITHPIRVYDLVNRSVRKFGKEWSEAMKCAALLHDTLESSGKKLKTVADKERAQVETRQKIISAFPDHEFAMKVIGLVDELTNPIEYKDANGKEISKQDWQVNHIKNISMPACTVKICDQTANLISDLEEMPQWDYDRITKYRQKADAVVDAAPTNDNLQYFSIMFSKQMYKAISEYSKWIFDGLKKDADAGLISFPLDKKHLTFCIDAFDEEAKSEALQKLNWREKTIIQMPDKISEILTKLTRDTGKSVDGNNRTR